VDLALHAFPHAYTSKGDDCFEKATSFIPERWCDSPELVKIKAGFAPFGTGKGLGQKN